MLTALVVVKFVIVQCPEFVDGIVVSIKQSFPSFRNQILLTI